VLSQGEIGAFMAEGYLAVRSAVPSSVADACQQLTWPELAKHGVVREDLST
jgi:hypothetical protein